MLSEERVRWAVEPDSNGHGILVLDGWGARPVIRRGGRVVLFTGRGERIRFTAVADISETEGEKNLARRELAPRQPVNIPAEPWQLSLKLAHYQKLPEAAKLLNFAYSLSFISNLAEPWRHVRHTWTMPDVDVETLLLQRIHAARTSYFGILAGLPESWSTALDGLAKSRRMGRMAAVSRSNISYADDNMSYIDNDGTALPELVELLETHVVSVAQSAATIAELHPRVLPGESYPEVVALADNNERAWNMAPLLRIAGQRLPEVQATGPLLREADETRGEDQFPRIEWRPYRL